MALPLTASGFYWRRWSIRLIASTRAGACVRLVEVFVHLSQPSRDACNGLMHLVSRTGIGKADKRTAVNRIEVDAGRCRNMRLFQHLAGKLETVGSKLGNVGVEVKRAVGGQELVNAGLRQAVNQNAAVFLIDPLHFFHLERA